MGNRNCCVNGITKSKLPFTGDIQPDNDILNSLHPRANNILSFQIKISNIKLKFLPENQAFLNIKLENIVSFNTQKKKRGNDNCIKWSIQKKLDVKVTQLELRKKFIEITIFNEEEHDVAQVRINLYKISTGPYHHDFPLIYPNNIFGRICVDIRSTQIVEVSIKSELTSSTLIKERPEQLFNYSIKIIRLNNSYNQQSDTSYNAEIVTMKKSIKNLLNEDENQSKNLKKNNWNNDSELAHKIVWTSNQATIRGLSLPMIKSNMFISDFSTASFQFLLWQVSKNIGVKSDKNSSKKSMENQLQTNMLCGQCYVPFNKIIQKDFELVQKGNIIFECRKLELAEKIWIHGKLIGEMKMRFTVVIPQFYKQMIVFVRTQQGIKKNSPIFNIAEDEKIQCVQLRELTKLKVELEDLNSKIGCALQHTKKQLQIKRLKQDVKFNLFKIQPLLSFTIRESTFLYSYKIQAHLFLGQKTLLAIGFKLLDYLQEQETSVHNICWKCLILLLRRGQLTLVSIGFQENHSYVKQKIELAIKYQSFLYRSLKLVLISLTKKALQENERIFVQLFCAYSFFRIPEFRKVFLNVISKPQDQDIEENEAHSFIIKKVNKENENTFNLLFDWQSHFYNHIPHDDERVKQNYTQLNDTLNIVEWKHRMQKRGIAFFFFIVFWIQYVKQIAVNSQNIKWKYLPGYVQILSAFIWEMKTRPIAQYPDGLKDASIKLLENEKLLNIFITILFEKTNIYDSITVMNTLDIINEYFKELNRKKKQLPTMFNYTFFLAGIRDMLIIDHSFIVSRCMLLIYNNYNIFSNDFKNDISLILLGRLFFRLFLHWSKNVRNMFYHLLIFRILLQSSIVKKQENDQSIVQQHNRNNQEIQRKLKILRQILQKTQHQRQKQQIDIMTVKNEKELYRRMKKKKKNQLYNKDLKKQIILNKINSSYEIFSKQSFVIHPTSSPFMKHTVSNTFELNSPTKIRKQIPPIENDKESIEQQLVEKPFEKKKAIKKMNIKQEDAAIQEILPEHYQYLSLALKEFYITQEIYQEKFTNRTELDAVPIIEIHIPIDEGEIRPETIDEW